MGLGASTEVARQAPVADLTECRASEERQVGKCASKPGGPRRGDRARALSGEPLAGLALGLLPRKWRIESIKKSFAAAAGLEDVHPHDRRRTCGSWFVQAGVGIERVSRLLRHSDVSVTARVYAHLRPLDLAETAAVVDGSGEAIFTWIFTFADRHTVRTATSRPRPADSMGGNWWARQGLNL